MDFTSLAFLIFLSGVCLIYFIVPRSCRSFWLLACSYVYYIQESKNISFVVLLLAATAVTYAAGIAISTSKNKYVRKGFLLASIAVSMGSLLFYKYFTFFNVGFANLLNIFGIKLSAVSFNLAIPLGISYFTFMALSYVIDIYRGKYPPEKNFFYYALYVSFFPCIVTGPISRANNLLPQFKKTASFDYNRVAGGLFRILWGLFKRLVIADRLDAIVSIVYKNNTQFSGPMLVIASLLFSYELYCNFSASIDIAIGASTILGIDVCENFRRPLSAASFTDLWRRWHMSLTSWFKDYIYIPLGGNRKGAVRTYVNQIIIFLVSGLWHGAALNYIVWGLLNGIYLCIGKATAPLRSRLELKNPLYRVKFIKRIIQTVITYSLFTTCIVFFCMALKGGDLKDSFAFYGQMFTNWNILFEKGALLSQIVLTGTTTKMMIVLALSTIAVEVLEFLLPNIQKSIRKVPFFVRWPIYYSLLLCLLYFGNFAQSANIYQAY